MADMQSPRLPKLDESTLNPDQRAPVSYTHLTLPTILRV